MYGVNTVVSNYIQYSIEYHLALING